MTPETSAVDAIIDRAARALITPPPDDALLSRVLTRLPERPVGGRQIRWVPAAAVAALLAWLMLRPTPEPMVVPGEPPVLVATDAWRALVSMPASAAPARPREGAPARLDVRVRVSMRGASTEPWGLTPLDAPGAIEVPGLTGSPQGSRPVDVAPLTVAAISPPAALSDMKE